MLHPNGRHLLLQRNGLPPMVPILSPWEPQWNDAPDAHLAELLLLLKLSRDWPASPVAPGVPWAVASPPPCRAAVAALPHHASLEAALHDSGVDLALDGVVAPATFCEAAARATRGLAHLLGLDALGDVHPEVTMPPQTVVKESAFADNFIAAAG